MPTMANITVKNAANADVIYVAKSPSAGDRSPAVWTRDAAHAVPGFRPRVTALTRDNGNKTGRLVEIEGTFPMVQTINGVDTKVSSQPFKFYTTIPQGVADASTYDNSVQFSNLLVAALMREVFNTGYAPG